MTSTKVLIVDDEPAVLEIMVHKVSAAGFTVLSAHNGKEAIDLIKAEQPDVLLLDLIMPVMDGFEVLKSLRSNPPSEKWMPVVVISTMDEIQHLQKSLDSQVDHYLTKPCTIEEVIKAVKSMLSLIPLRNS